MNEKQPAKASIVRRGRGEPPEPIDPEAEVVRLADCPDCEGRGWFLINPFATGGSNGAGGVRNITQCLTCADAYAYWQEHGELPELVVSIFAPSKGATDG